MNQQYQYKVAEEKKNHLFVSDAKSFDFFKSDLHQNPILCQELNVIAPSVFPDEQFVLVCKRGRHY